MYSTPDMIHLMEGSARQVARARIKRPEQAARSRIRSLERESLESVTGIYQQARADIEQRILNFRGADGSLALARMQDLMAQLDVRLAQLSIARNTLLEDRLRAAASRPPFPPPTSVAGHCASPRTPGARPGA